VHAPQSLLPPHAFMIVSHASAAHDGVGHVQVPFVPEEHSSPFTHALVPQFIELPQAFDFMPQSLPTQLTAGQ
jgi:hypothetical protein